MKPDSYNILPFGPPKMRPIIQNVFKTVTSLLQSEWQNKNKIYTPKKSNIGLGQFPWNLKTVIEWSNFRTVLILIQLCSVKYNVTFNLRKKMSNSLYVATNFWITSKVDLRAPAASRSSLSWMFQRS